MKKLFFRNASVLVGVLVLAVLMSLVFTSAVFAHSHMNRSDVLEVALEADDFNTLVTAVIEADLVFALKGEGPFTVFAPTDEAFANLPEGVLESLLADKEALADVLLYHVVSGKVMAEDVVTLDGAEVSTLLGENVRVTVEDGNVFINDSQVIATDIEASNGVIHVIDEVLVP